MGDNHTFKEPFLREWGAFTKAYVIIIVVLLSIATVLDALIIGVLIHYKPLRKPSNVILANFLLGNVIFTQAHLGHLCVSLANSHYMGGQVYCDFAGVILNITVSNELFSLAFMSLDRFLAVKYSYAISSKTVLLTSIVAWCLFTLSATLAFFDDDHMVLRLSANCGHSTLVFHGHIGWAAVSSLVAMLDFTILIIVMVVLYILLILHIRNAGKRLRNSIITGVDESFRLASRKEEARLSDRHTNLASVGQPDASRTSDCWMKRNLSIHYSIPILKGAKLLNLSAQRSIVKKLLLLTIVTVVMWTPVLIVMGYESVTATLLPEELIFFTTLLVFGQPLVDGLVILYINVPIRSAIRRTLAPLLNRW
ncbi:hypothetical protein SeLEV6574_g06464 [Synchytrium endobioticum]|uniref:G-protein coupled receptors family 1 profile domain-containing protein n=1 Tax=Synchytrium endobioticum TaxID=286115 RepID=A0A507CNJ8_9FUNG|nr:hypothetical protein SeLEV6574_g06464 [Synchytrium endobioticum]